MGQVPATGRADGTRCMTIPARGPRATFGASGPARETKSRVHEALSLGREHPEWSATRAAREAGTTLTSMERYAPDALQRQPSGRLRIKAADRGVRIMPIVSAGIVYPQVAILGSRQASLVGRHLAAISTFLSAGDDRLLRSFAGKTVAGTLPSGERLRFELEADADVIAELGFVGELGDLVIES